MQLFAKINGAKKEKEDLVDEKGVGSSNEPGSAEQMGAVGICPHLLIGRFIINPIPIKRVRLRPQNRFCLHLI